MNYRGFLRGSDRAYIRDCNLSWPRVLNNSICYPGFSLNAHPANQSFKWSVYFVILHKIANIFIYFN